MTDFEAKLERFELSLPMRFDRQVVGGQGEARAIPAPRPALPRTGGRHADGDCDQGRRLAWRNILTSAAGYRPAAGARSRH